MPAEHDLIERGIPDLIDSDDLAPVVAAEVDFLAGRFAGWAERGSPAVRARAAAASGDEARAAALLADVDLSAGDNQQLASAAWAVSRVGPPSMAETLLVALREQPALLVEDGVPLGPRALAEGPLIAATGDLDSAVVRLEQAIAIGDARAPLWGALARVELARIKLCAEVVGDAGPPTSGPAVDQLLSAAGLFFRAGGYRSLLERTGRLTRPDEHIPPLGGPTVGRLRPGRPWRVGFGVMGDVSQRESKGLAMLHHLVQNPGRPFPAIALDRLVKGGDIEAIMATSDAGVDEIRARLYDDAVRSRVGKLLSRTIKGIESDHPLLAGHLRATVRTGHACRYDPPGGRAVVWVV
ncbi:MAG: hypothetical protein R2707_15970 [Acidimicrobiales bacterium]